MSVADSISGALQRFGRPMILRRLTLGPGGIQIPLDVTVYGRSKNLEAKELIGELAEGATEITITNAEISAGQWPGPPRRDDKFVVDGRVRNVQSVEPKYLGTEVLVFVCKVQG